MPADWRSPAYLARLGGVTLLYYVAGKIGLSLALVHPSASAIWAPSGVALAALLLMGARAWPAVFAGAFLVNETTAGSLATSIAIAGGNTLEAVAGAYLVTRFAHGRRCLDHVGGIFRFAALAGLCATTASATIGVTSLCLAGFAPWSQYDAIWFTWWLGDATGVLVVAPPLLLWAADHSLADLRRRWLEAGLLLVAVVGTGVMVYFGLLPFPETAFPMRFLSIPTLLWAALRFGRREVATLLLLLAATAIAAILKGHGSAPPVSENQLFLLLQVFMSVISVTMLAVATLFFERKRAEEAYRRSEERYRILADTVPVIVFSAMDDGRGIYCNERWFEYTGMTAEASRDLGWLSAVHLDDVRTHEGDWLRTLARGEAFRLEIRLRRADGLYRWHAVRAVPWRDGRGTIARWIGTCTDIEDRKRADADREGLLTFERSARVEAEAANRAKDEFLAMLSHELQTPLSIVLLWATLLRSGGLDQAGVARALDIIEQNARAQNQMIVDLLDVSRIAAGKLALHPQRIAPGPIVQTAIDALRPIAESKGISISAQVDSGVGLIVCDAQRLLQVVSNLVGNGIKFTPAGGRVEVALFQDGEVARLTVSDTGYGISSEFLPHVFERFRQADTGLTRKHGGLGLGLAIVRHLVQLHGGTVSVSSEGENKGATFTVLLPVRGAGTLSSLL